MHLLSARFQAKAPRQAQSSGPLGWLGVAENQFAYTARDLWPNENSEAAAVATIPAVKEQRLVVRISTVAWHKLSESIAPAPVEC